MKSPCVAYPADEPLVLIRASQVRLCEGNHCAAALLSYFGYWHTIRLEQLQQAEHANKVAALHGEAGTQDTTLLQYHTEEAIEAGLLHLYGRKTIRTALAFLVGKGFLSIHTNPNPRYRFDKTHYFLFHPDAVQEEIDAAVHEVKVPHRSGKNTSSGFTEEENHDINDSEHSVHEVKVPHRSGNFAASSGKTAAPIAEITSEITQEKKEDLTHPYPPLERQGIPITHNGTCHLLQSSHTLNGHVSVLAQTDVSVRKGPSRTKALQQPNTAYTPGFNKAWALYPRKEKKVDTFTIWRERGLEARAAEIAEKIARLQVTLWAHKEMRYIPLPTTWFNEARYEDDLIALDVAQDVAVRTRTTPREYHNLMAAKRWQEEKFGPQGSSAVPGSHGEVIDGVSYRIERVEN